MSKYPVIIDCDPGIDDSLALLLAMLSPEIELLGISVSAGNVDLPQACLNAKRMVSCCQKEIPIIP